MPNTIKNSILFIITVTAIGILLFIDPIPQDPAYHHFADTRNILRIPNFFNVISNAPLVLIGMWGLIRFRSVHIPQSMKQHYLIFCAGVFLIGWGSFYYHLQPDNSSLVWDRLPMTIAFMSFFSALITEYISVKIGYRLLYPLLLLGAASVLYWYITETMGAGDLRPYAAVQYIPLALTPLILIFYRPEHTFKSYVIWSLVFYGLAKIMELADANLFALSGNILSGHAIKHLLAAAGSVCIINMFINTKAGDFHGETNG